MRFTYNQKQATFIERENRFVGLVELMTEDHKEKIKVHIPNTGRCKELLFSGNAVVLEERTNPNRKYPYELILVNKEGRWISIDSQIPNRLAYDAISDGTIHELSGYEKIKREHTEGNSRFDLYLEKENGEKCFVEVKGVTLEKDGIAMFPDAPTERGRKHLEELIRLKKEGHRCGVLFIVQMDRITKFRPYYENDPEFAATLERAEKEGVEIFVYTCEVSREAVTVRSSITHFFEAF